MRAPRGSGGRLRALTAAMWTTLTVASCGGPGAEEAKGKSADTCDVRRETDQITARFPSFGRLESTSWCGITLGVESRFPGPTDVRLVGLLDAVDDKPVRDELADPALHFVPATPTDLPPEIAKLLPKGAEWMASEQVEARITQSYYEGTFYYDRRSGQVLFDCVNPELKETPSPKATQG